MAKAIRFANDTYLDTSNVIYKGRPFDFNNGYNTLNFCSDSSWMPLGLSNLGAKKVLSTSSKDNINGNAGEFGLAYYNGTLNPYSDGYFYQGESGDKCLDTACCKLLWSYDGAEWGDGATGTLPLESYDFVLVQSTQDSQFVPTTNLSGNLTAATWSGTLSADCAFDRSFWGENGGIKFGYCYGRGINGYTKFGQDNGACVPRRIYGFRFMR